MKEGNNASDSSSSTSLENMDKGGEPPTVQSPEMEQKMDQLFEILPNLSMCLAVCVETRTSSESAMQSLAGSCQNNTAKILTQGATLKSFQNLTGTIQHWLSEVEKSTATNIRRILVAVDSINNLGTSHDSLKRDYNRMPEHLQQNRAASAAEGASSTRTADSCETGIFVRGINNFREIFDMTPNPDPVVVAGRLMYEIGSYGAINRVYVAERAVDKKERYKAQAVIIYLNTLFHKTQAVIKLKTFLQMNPGLRATLYDVFPSTKTLALTRHDADMRTRA